jgi:hypothetical protein
MKIFVLFLGITLALFFYSFNTQTADNEKIFEERNGVLAVEAEHFFSQSKTGFRRWHVIDSEFSSQMQDPDGNHANSASGEKYLECLPDTRVTHDDKLTAGENFSNKAGEMAVLHYQVFINNPGRYYVWVRAFSTGTEDNGIHVGIDGAWPESGQRMQWCEGKNEWTWDSKQRTQEVHCGEPKLIYLDIEQPGIHDIQFSMREDGFEFDKFLMEKEYQKPQGTGPAEHLKDKIN